MTSNEAVSRLPYRLSLVRSAIRGVRENLYGVEIAEGLKGANGKFDHPGAATGIYRGDFRARKHQDVR